MTEFMLYEDTQRVLAGLTAAQRIWALDEARWQFYLDSTTVGAQLSTRRRAFNDKVRKMCLKYATMNRGQARKE